MGLGGNFLYRVVSWIEILCGSSSVTGLGNFLNFLATNFLTKEAQIFW